MVSKDNLDFFWRSSFEYANFNFRHEKHYAFTYIILQHALLWSTKFFKFQNHLL